MAGFRFAVVDTAAGLSAHVAAWEELAAAALEPNPFYEPWMLLPAIEAFGHGVPLRYVFAYAEVPGHAPTLCGFFPLERVARYKGLPFRHVRLWQYPHRYLGTPLLRRHQASACMEAFLAWLADSGEATMMQWGRVSGDGSFHGVFQEAMREAGWRSSVGLAFSRAVLRPNRDGEAYLQDGEAYLRQALPGAKRKELRRLERRLSENGGLRYEVLEAGAPADSWIEAFLALEASGWKGRGGSALACTEQGRRFFRAVAAGAALRRRLMMLSLAVGERPVAMKCNLLAQDGAFAFKIAYDEDYARFSPGTLLELENIRELHRRPALRWMDSCAEADHFMANRLWLERRAIVNVLSATARTSGGLVVSSLPLLRRVAAPLRSAAPQGA